MWIAPKEPNHYELFALDEGASSREIRRAYLGGPHTWPPGPWRWAFFHNPKLVERLDERCHEAYRVIGDPENRRAYDEHQGFTREHLARRIGRRWATWGVVWIITFVLLGFGVTLDGSENVAMLLGNAFAPDFHQQWRIVGPDQHRELIYFSSNEQWESALNNGNLMSFVPGLLLMGIGVGGAVVLNRVAGEIIARVRCRGYRDTFVRGFIWAFTVAGPAAVFLMILTYGNPPNRP